MAAAANAKSAPPAVAVVTPIIRRPQPVPITARDEITLCLPFNVCDEDEAVRMITRARRRILQRAALAASRAQTQTQTQSESGSGGGKTAPPIIRSHSDPGSSTEVDSSAASAGSGSGEGEGADTKSPAPSSKVLALAAAATASAAAAGPNSATVTGITQDLMPLGKRIELYKLKKMQARITCFFLPSDDVNTDLTAHFRCFIGNEPLSTVWGMNSLGQPTTLVVPTSTTSTTTTATANTATSTAVKSTPTLTPTPAATTKSTASDSKTDSKTDSKSPPIAVANAFTEPDPVMRAYYAYCEEQAYATPPNPHALNNLAMSCLMGFGGPRDLKRVWSLLTAAMSGGSVAAANNHAVCLALGVYADHGGAQPVKAFQTLKQIVDSAPSSQSAPPPSIVLVNLGTCYQAAIGVEQDYTRAVELYRLALQDSTGCKPEHSSIPNHPSRGHVRGHSLLGLMYEHGFGPIQQSEKFSEDHYLIAAERGYCYSQRELGALYGRDGFRKSDIKSFRWFQKAALQGFTECQLRVGECYESGRGVEWNERLAYYWYELAASHGSAELRREGLLMMAYSHRNGVGVPLDLSRAYDCYKRAAELGSPEAMTVRRVYTHCNSHSPTDRFFCLLFGLYRLWPN